jgi:hypothetical protein
MEKKEKLTCQRNIGVKENPNTTPTHVQRWFCSRVGHFRVKTKRSL